MDTLQTQWSWILQITKCIDVHLKENAAYFQVSSDVENSHYSFKKCESHPRYFSCTRIFLNACLNMCNTLLPYCKCCHSARCELGFLVKRVHWFLASIFKSCVQLKSQLSSNSSLKRPKPQSATWKTCKTPSERSSSVIRACHYSLCWSRSKSWRYCHTHMTGYVLLSLEISCPF